MKTKLEYKGNLESIANNNKNTNILTFQSNTDIDMFYFVATKILFYLSIKTRLWITQEIKTEPSLFSNSKLENVFIMQSKPYSLLVGWVSIELLPCLDRLSWINISSIDFFDFEKS